MSKYENLATKAFNKMRAAKDWDTLNRNMSLYVEYKRQAAALRMKKFRSL